MTEAEKRQLMSATQQRGYSGYNPAKNKLASQLMSATQMAGYSGLPSNNIRRGTVPSATQLNGYSPNRFEFANMGDEIPLTTPVVEEPAVVEEPIVVEEVATGSRNVAGMGTGGGFVSSVVPEAQTISREEALAQAKSQFLETFGNDPNWQAKLAEYQGDVDAAYEAILGEEGPLAEGRRLAEETFRRQSEEARTGFRQSRQQLAEQSFLGERQLQQQLAARGLGGAGLAQLGGVQQQIAQGRAATGLYSEFTRSLENIAAAEAKNAQQFAEAESNLKLGLSQQKLQLKQQIDQQQRAYDQFKGQTINSLQAAIQSNDYQSYQLAMQDYSLTKQLEAETRQTRLDGLAYTTQIIERLYDNLLAEAEGIKNDAERESTIKQLRADLVSELAMAGEDLTRYDEGLVPREDIISGISSRYGFATQPTERPEATEETGSGLTTGSGPLETGSVDTGTYTPGQVGTNAEGELFAINADGRRTVVGDAARSFGYQYKGLTEIPAGIELKVGNLTVPTTGKINEGSRADRPSIGEVEDGDVYVQLSTTNTGYENRKVFVKDQGAWRQLSQEEANKLLATR
jgi:uncharacterized protein YqeY